MLERLEELMGGGREGDDDVYYVGGGIMVIMCIECIKLAILNHTELKDCAM